jgi:hypothetical protein
MQRYCRTSKVDSPVPGSESLNAADLGMESLA